MKMIVAIIRDLDYDSVTTALTHANFRVTCIAAHGGFLKRKNCTLYIGIDDDQVQTVKEMIRNNCTAPEEENFHRATIFVLPVIHTKKF